MAGKKSMLEGVLELPSSKYLFGLCDNYDENVLISLIEEAHERGLPMNSKIKIFNRELDWDAMPSVCDDPKPYLIFVHDTIKLSKLHEFYERNFSRKYSPEGESERSGFSRAVTEREGQRRTAWGVFVSTMNALRVAEKEKEIFEKEGEKGLKKYRESVSNNLFYIG